MAIRTAFHCACDRRYAGTICVARFFGSQSRVHEKWVFVSLETSDHAEAVKHAREVMESAEG